MTHQRIFGEIACQDLCQKVTTFHKNIIQIINGHKKCSKNHEKQQFHHETAYNLNFIRLVKVCIYSKNVYYNVSELLDKILIRQNNETIGLQALSKQAGPYSMHATLLKIRHSNCSTANKIVYF